MADELGSSCVSEWLQSVGGGRDSVVDLWLCGCNGSKVEKCFWRAFKETRFIQTCKSNAAHIGIVFVCRQSVFALPMFLRIWRKLPPQTFISYFR